ncbi:MAG: ParB family protein [Pseudomonas sp.]
MKTPTSEEINQKLEQTHFAQVRSLDRLSDPCTPTSMVVTLEQLRPYEHNPRVVRNPLYAELKASIRDRGLDQPPPITRRPGEAHFIIRNGGNTRLAILNELWQETRDDQFFRVPCLFRPWTTEMHALVGHLTESDLHGQLTFVERALAVAKLNDMFAQDESVLSQRELSLRLSEDGYPISQPHISRMFDTLEYLLPAIPQILYGGLGKSVIERVIGLRRRAEHIWNRYAHDVSTFTPMWLEVLSAFDAEPDGFDLAQVQDELLGHMARALNQSPRLLALELLQQPTSPSPTAETSRFAEPIQERMQCGTVPGNGLETVPESNPSVPVTEPMPEAVNSLAPPSQAERAIQGDTNPAPLAKVDDVHPHKRLITPASLDELWPIAPSMNHPPQLREACATLARQLAEYAGLGQWLTAQGTELGFSLSLSTTQEVTSARSTGMQLLLMALLGTQDEVMWPHCQQLPAALFGQLMTGVYDLPSRTPPALSIGLERLPDQQLLQLFQLIRLSRRLIECSLLTTR